MTMPVAIFRKIRDAAAQPKEVTMTGLRYGDAPQLGDAGGLRYPPRVGAKDAAGAGDLYQGKDKARYAGTQRRTQSDARLSTPSYLVAPTQR
ncbi:hypothetical protein [Sphingomonas crocodyli]|uniref:Uncharacterized protein n=1 Tax=Sphingomonas crocodyli TaxID=1979270 RepID=A0A437LYE7_9SPHN|nr:hypothetical protein [Sphingomonas crocodyli]RVT90407.1 hypothetical protein EOD43_19285 [Sphingomonas crocodyli]